MDKILITGVSGFLGSNLLDYLLKNTQHQIFGIDNFSNSNISNLYMPLKNERFNFWQQDINSEISFYTDIVYHFAQSNNPSLYAKNKYNYIKDNLKSLDSILNYCSKNDSKFIYISEIISPEKENDINYKEYQTFIKMSEELISDYAITNKIKFKIIKLPEIYGENFNIESKNFLNVAIKKIFQNQDIVIKNDYYNYFTYIKDILPPFYNIINSQIEENTLEISSDKAYLLSDIINLIIQITTSKSQIIIENKDIFKPATKPNLQISTSILGYKEINDIGKNILSTMNYYKNKFIL